jgi:predicted transcriptional regulator
LLEPGELEKVKVVNYTLSWENVEVFITSINKQKEKVAFEVGADTLYHLSEEDEELKMSIGATLKKARLAAKLSQEEVAILSGTSRTYITKLENDKQDVEIMTLKKIVEAGLNRHLKISIVK